MLKKHLPSFYNPRLDVQSSEEKFLLKRRIRLMANIGKLDRDSKWYWKRRVKLIKQLKETENKLGIKQ